MSEENNIKGNVNEDIDMIKPFVVNNKTGEEKKLIKPFVVNDKSSKLKLYLILKYYNSGNDGAEDYRDFEFFNGTTSDVYAHLKLEIETSTDFDVMRSRILVDSPNISISHKCSIYTFMKDAKDTGRVIDNTSFDIQDYYYDEMEVDNIG